MTLQPTNPRQQPLAGGDLTSREEQAQFEQLFASYGRRLFGYIVACLHNRQDAEEVFGETSLILWREFSKFRRDAEFMPWATRIAFNQVRKYRRKRGRHLNFSDPMLEELAQDAATIQDRLDERRLALAHCLQQLGEKYRGLIDSFYSRRTSAGEVANKWSCSVHTVYKALKETRRRLHECVSRRISAE
jgi:RNA polymerase sigma-70 factor (ECF subfamily)